MEDRYDLAQICKNGHVITEYFQEYPAVRKEYCPTCGEKTITMCQKCQGAIRGALLGELPSFGNPVAPLYCEHCGSPYPWTESAIRSAIELWVEESHASEDEAKQFEQTVNDLVKESPRTPLAVSRFRKAMGKVGSSVSSGIYQITIDVLSESVKKAIWGK